MHSKSISQFSWSPGHSWSHTVAASIPGVLFFAVASHYHCNHYHNYNHSPPLQLPCRMTTIFIYHSPLCTRFTTINTITIVYFIIISYLFIFSCSISQYEQNPTSLYTILCTSSVLWNCPCIKQKCIAWLQLCQLIVYEGSK